VRSRLPTVGSFKHSGAVGLFSTRVQMRLHKPVKTASLGSENLCVSPQRFAFCTVLLAVFCASPLQCQTACTQIRVGLLSLGSRTAVTVETNGPAVLYELPSERTIGRVANPCQITFKASQGRLTASPNLFQAPVQSLRLECSSGFLINKRRYPGTLEVRTENNSRILLINCVPLEEYVKGAVAAEADRAMHPEALKALAVAARTFALANTSRHNGSGFNLCDTTHCQGYLGACTNQRIASAVAQTSGQILVYENLPIVAAYCTNCGGATANNEDAGFGSTPKPYLRAVKDAPPNGLPDYCSYHRLYTWSRTFNLEEIAKAVSTYLKLLDGTDKPIRQTAFNPENMLIESLSFDNPDAFGRSRTVTLRFRLIPQNQENGSRGHAPPQEASSNQQGAAENSILIRTIPSHIFRRLLGEDKLPSTAASVKPLGNRCIEISGRGYGHGVGMCLSGANGMASPPHNRTYKQILAHYYGPAVITSLTQETAATRRPPLRQQAQRSPKGSASRSDLSKTPARSQPYRAPSPG